MCNPRPHFPTSMFIWGLCQDDVQVRHYLPNPDITVGPDHNYPQFYSVTNGAGDFNIIGDSMVGAMAEFLRQRHALGV